ncbi:MAG: hypothetical protein AAF560_26020 [Acidobacteriota bacterium]
MPFLRMVKDRLRQCEAVENAIRHHGQRVADVVSVRFQTLLPEGREIPDFWQLQLFLLDLLQGRKEQMAAAEQAHVDELADDAEPRGRRDRFLARLGSQMVGMRSAFAGIYRPEDIELLGFPRRIARDPESLLRQADRLIQRLNDPSLVLPVSQFGAAALAPVEMAQALVPDVESLRTALVDVGREVKEAQATLIDRDRAIAEFDAIFLWIARTLESLYRLAGEDGLANRVRPSVRQRKAKSKDEPQASDASGEAPSEGDAEPLAKDDAETEAT